MIDDRRQLVEDFARGTTELKFTEVELLSEHFVVFKIAGHDTWQDVMNPSVYQPVEHILERKHVWCLRETAARKSWTGRVSRKVLQAALDEAEAKYNAS
jgi:hypothetical protein